MGGTVAIYLALQRPELVSNLVVCEGNIATGGGPGTQLFTSVPESEFVSTFFPEFLAKWREDGKGGDDYAFWRCGAWETSDFAGVYKQCAALVNLDPDFKQKYLSLPIKRTFVYGEEDLPVKTGEVKADAPDPDELRANGISVAVVPGVGHSMMIPNPSGFAAVVDAAL
jgi:pimeloyl-ACP methyl ester carboxylesterase